MKKNQINLGDLIRGLKYLSPKNDKTVQEIVTVLGFALSKNLSDKSLVDRQPAAYTDFTSIPTDRLNFYKEPSQQEKPIIIKPEQEYLDFTITDLTPNEESKQPPEWVIKAEPFDKEVLIRRNKAIKEPLFDPQTITATLTEAISYQSFRGEVNIEKLVEKVAKMEPILFIPKVKTFVLAPPIQLLIDKSEAMMPFGADQEQLLIELLHIIGTDKVEILWFEKSPLYAYKNFDDELSTYKLPPEKTVVLLLTDLGIGHPSLSIKRATLDEWDEFIQTIKHNGSYPVAIVPYHPNRCPTILQKEIKIIHWDRKTLPKKFKNEPLETNPNDLLLGKGVEGLIARLTIENPNIVTIAETLSLAARIEPELLRTTRLFLGLDVDVEADFYFSSIVQSKNHQAVLLFPQVTNYLRHKLKESKKDTLDQSWNFLKNFRKDNNYPLLLQLEEEISYLSLYEDEQNIQNIQNLFERILKTLLTLKTDNDEEYSKIIARWVIATIKNLPNHAKGLPIVRELLGVVAAYFSLPVTFNFGQDSSSSSWIFENILTSKIGIKITSKEIEFSDNPKNNQTIDVPKTNPIILDILYPDNINKQRIELRPGETKKLQIQSQQSFIHICTLGKQQYKLDIEYDNKVLDLPDGISLKRKFVVSNETKSPITQLIWSSDGNKIVACTSNGIIKILNIVNNQECVLQNPSKSATCLTWSSKNDFLIVGDIYGNIYVWNIETKTLVSTLKNHSKRIYALNWLTKDEESVYLCSFSEDNLVTQWDLRTASVLNTNKCSISKFSGLAWCPDWHHIAIIPVEKLSANLSLGVEIWSLKNKWDRYISYGFQSDLSALTWSLDGKCLALGSLSGQAWLIFLPWNEKLSRQVSFQSHSNPIHSISISADKDFLASKSLDGTINFWYQHNQKLLTQINMPSLEAFVNLLAFHPSKLILATLGKNDSTVFLLEIDRSKILEQWVTTGQLKFNKNVPASTREIYYINRKEISQILWLSFCSLAENTYSSFYNVPYSIKECDKVLEEISLIFPDLQRDNFLQDDREAYDDPVGIYMAIFDGQISLANSGEQPLSLKITFSPFETGSDISVINDTVKVSLVIGIASNKIPSIDLRDSQTLTYELKPKETISIPIVIRFEQRINDDSWPFSSLPLDKKAYFLLGANKYILYRLDEVLKDLSLLLKIESLPKDVVKERQSLLKFNLVVQDRNKLNVREIDSGEIITSSQIIKQKISLLLKHHSDYQATAEELKNTASLDEMLAKMDLLKKIQKHVSTLLKTNELENWKKDNNPFIHLLQRGYQDWNSWRELNPTEVIDLSNQDLSKYKFHLNFINFTDVNLKEANLSGIDLTKAQLTRADLSGAILINTKLNSANLVNAKLVKAQLKGNKILYGDFFGADFTEADLTDVVLESINLNKASFVKSYLYKTHFINTALEQADFTESYWGETNLSRVNLDTVKGLDSIHHQSTSKLITNSLIDTSKLPSRFTNYCNIEFNKFHASTLTESPNFLKIQQEQQKITTPLNILTSNVYSKKYIKIPERNPFFIERKNELRQLSELLTTHKAVMIKQMVNGLGGIGKTQTAIEYCYSYIDSYQSILWVNAENLLELSNSYTEIGKILDLLSSEIDQSFNLEELTFWIKTWLAQNKNWLLVLDDLEDIALIRTYLPSNHQGHILITTSTDILSDKIGILTLENMGVNIGTNFLLKRAGLTGRNNTKKQYKELAQKIVEVTAGFPLALEHVGAFIEKTKFPLMEYLLVYNKKSQELSSKLSLYDSEHKSVIVTFMIALNQIASNSPIMTEILKVCAFLSSEDIAEEIFIESGISKLQFTETVTQASGYSLIQKNDKNRTISIHRFVQQIIKDFLIFGEQKLRLEQVIKTLNNIFPQPDQTDWYSSWLKSERLLPHVRTMIPLIKEFGIESFEAGRLLHSASIYCKNQGLYLEAMNFSECALTITEKLLGSQSVELARVLNVQAELYNIVGKHSLVEETYLRALRIFQKLNQELQISMVLNNLSNFHYKQYKHAQAESELKQALEIRQKLLEPGHPDLASTFNNLALVYHRQTKYSEARDLFEKALAITEKVFGREHPKLVTILNNLAETNLFLGKSEQSSQYIERSQKIAEKIAVPNHPTKATTLHTLGNLSKFQGKYKEAEEYYQKALTTQEILLGPEHLDLARVLNDLASLKDIQGNILEAEDLFKRVLNILEKQLPTNHPDILAALNNLGSFYDSHNKTSEAEPFYDKILTILPNIVNNKDPDIGTMLNNLAEFYRKKKDYSKAAPLYEQALEIEKRAVGEINYKVAITLENKALLCFDLQKYKESEDLLNQTLSIRKQVFGSNHPDVAKTLCNLGWLFFTQQRLNEAEANYEQAIKIKKQVFGEEHIEVTTTLGQLSQIYFSQNKLKEAENLCRRVLNIQEKVFRANDLSVAKTLNNLAIIYQAQSNYKESEIFYTRALQLYEKNVGKTDVIYIDALNSFATLYQEQGRYNEARSLYEQALIITKKVFGDVHPNIAHLLNNTASTYADQGQYQQALDFFHQALIIRKQLFKNNHPDIAQSLYNIGEIYRNQRKHNQALTNLEQATRIYSQVFGNNHPSVAQTLNSVASVYADQENYQRALECYDQVLSIYKQTFGNSHLDVAGTLMNIAIIYDEQKNYDKAETLYLEALNIFEQILGKYHLYTGQVLHNLGHLYQSIDKEVQAVNYFKQALNIYDEFLPNNHPWVVRLLYSYSNLLLKLSKNGEADVLLERIVNLKQPFEENNE